MKLYANIQNRFHILTNKRNKTCGPGIYVKTLTNRNLTPLKIQRIRLI